MQSRPGNAVRLVRAGNMNGRGVEWKVNFTGILYKTSSIQLFLKSIYCGIMTLYGIVKFAQHLFM